MTHQPSALTAVLNQPGARGAGRRLATGSAAAATVAAAASELTWATHSGPLGTIAVAGPLSGPPAVTMLAVLTAVSAAVLAVGMLRKWRTAAALVLVFGTAALAAVGALQSIEYIGRAERERLQVGPAGWLALSALGGAAALALLVASALYEGARAAHRPSRELLAAAVRVQSALPPAPEW